MSYKEFMQRYEDATNSHSFEEVEKLITDDAVFWFTSSSHKGKAEIRSYFENTWNTIQEEVYTISDVEWIAADEKTAVCIYRYNWRGIYKGEIVEGEGKGTNVCVNIDGSWKVRHEHLTPLPMNG
ncbi:YybH family protein [Paenibacillus thermotolerans]|uniref:YybH family protein n=1 Tax=Paenibacillus thermotolerans TaxID=3027807 RepID=UPI0023681805|nr:MULTISPECIES: nuclear transport factor 2 family protein [unclassified Paenibacillus]